MEKESPSHTDTFLRDPLWEEHVIQHQVKVANGLSGGLSPQHVNALQYTRHAIQTDDGPFETKAGHEVKVIGSHRQLPLGNVKGVGSIPPPLNEALQQGSTRGLLWKETNDGLKAIVPDVAPSFRGKLVEPFHHLIGASLTSIRE